MTNERIIEIGMLVNIAYCDTYAALNGYNIIDTIYGDDLATERKLDHSIPIQRVQYGFIAKRDNDIVVAIRGTTTAMEWLEDICFNLSPFGTNGRVEDGFLDVNNSLMTSNGDKITTALIKLKPDQVTFGGHSLGASESTIEAYRAVIAGLKVAHISFASPKVGNKDFADSYNAAGIDTIRLQNKRDIVPRQPPIGYEHTNGLVEVDGYGKAKDTWKCQHGLMTYLHCLDSNISVANQCQ